MILLGKFAARLPRASSLILADPLPPYALLILVDISFDHLSAINAIVTLLTKYGLSNFGPP